MSSKKCLHCGFTDFVEAETCKRCGEKLPTARQSEYRERISSQPMPVPTSPALKPKGNIRVTVAIVLGCVLVGSVWVSYANKRREVGRDIQAQNVVLPAASEVAGSPARREVYAGYLQDEYQNKGWNVRISVSGYDNTTLLMASPLFAGISTIDSNTVPALKGFASRLKPHGFQRVIFSDGNMPVGEEYISH